MDYGKIRTDGQIEKQTNPIRIVIGNPNETQKALCAELLGQLPMRYTDEPEYDPENQYVESHWEEIDGEAVQVWEIHDRPESEPTVED